MSAEFSHKNANLELLHTHWLKRLIELNRKNFKVPPTIMPALTLTATPQSWPLLKPFRISRGVKTTAETIIAQISDGTHCGKGECTPYARYGESVASVLSTLATIARTPDQFSTPQAIAESLPAGAARNALDCALIDYEAKKSGRSAANRFNLTLKPQITAYTLSLDQPAAMFEAALGAANRPVLKIKLGGGEGDQERLSAIRKAAPAPRLIVDANEGWSIADLDHHLKACLENRVDLIEQPFAVGQDDALQGFKSPIPLCADESLHTCADLDHLGARYQAINIKLDKSGGLHEALALMHEAERRQLTVMIGCMVASSLAMAPAFLIAQKARWIDRDGPLLLAKDHENGLKSEGSLLYPPSPILWG